jgi:peptidoglycan/LPS O-acetylase OafA/YrhL
VALFMCLSGYLFARILSDRKVVWRAFYWNRFIRFAPLLVMVFAIKGALIAHGHPGAVLGYLKGIIAGFMRPTWQNGAWSIAVEMHFYMLLRVIIPLKRWWLPSLFGFLASGLSARLLIYEAAGDVEYYAYWTIVDRIDQSALGIRAA